MLGLILENMMAAQKNFRALRRYGYTQLLNYTGVNPVTGRYYVYAFRYGESVTA
jgi:hypothetical protein